MKHLFIAAALALPVASFGADPEKALKFAPEKLDYYCTLQTGMKDRETHHQCLQESLGQTMAFSENFHAGLFKTKGIEPHVSRYFEMLSAWEDTLVNPWIKTILERTRSMIAEAKDLSDEDTINLATHQIGMDKILNPAEVARMTTNMSDFRTIRGYAKHCHQMIVDIAFEPDKSLIHSHTTAYGLPRYCVSSALRLSRNLNTPVDTADGSRLNAHFDRIDQYYKANPALPAPSSPALSN